MSGTSIGSLIWAAGIDNSGLRTGAKESSDIIQKVSKEQMAAQSMVIKNVIQDISKLKQELANVKPLDLQGKRDISADIKAANKALIDEKARLLDMQQKNVDANKQEGESHTSLIGGLGKWAMGLATVAGAMEVAKKIIASTEGTAKEFEFAVAGMNEGLSFFWKTLATGDFSGFLSNMESAIKAGHDYAQSMHEVKELGWAMTMTESDNLKKKADLEIKLRNVTLDPTERLKAGKERMAIEEEETGKRIKLANLEYKTNIDRLSERTGLEKDVLVGILKNVDDETKAKAEAFNKDKGYAKASEYQSSLEMMNKAGDKIPEHIRLLEDLKKSYDVAPEVQLYAASLRKEGTASEEMLVGVVDSYKKVNTAIASYSAGTKRIQTSINSVDEKIKTDALAAITKTNELNQKKLDYQTEAGRERINTQLKLDQELLNAEKDGAEKQRKQAELDYRKTLSDLGKQAEDKLKKQNEMSGGIVTVNGKVTRTKEYQTALPEADQEAYAQFAILAEQAKNDKIEKINELAAYKIKEIWRDVNDFALTGYQKEIAASKDKYDKLLKQAEENEKNPTKLLELKSALAEQSAKREQEITDKYALEKLDFEMKIAQDENAIKITGFNRAELLDKANFQSWVNIQTRKANILRASTDPKQREQGIAIEGEIKTETTNKNLEKEKKLREEVLFAAGELTGILTENGVLSKEQGEAIGKSLDGFKALASGDILGAAMSVVSQIASMFPSQAAQFQDRIDRINAALKVQQRLIELSDRFGGERVSREEELRLLNEKKKADEEALANAERKRDNKIFKFGPVYAGYKKNVDDLTASLVEDQAAIDDAQTALTDFLTGGVTENTLADTIAQAFEDGKTSVDDFATYMNDVLKNAGIEIFKSMLLDSEEMKAYKAYIDQSFKNDGKIDAAEKKEIDKRAAEIADKYASQYDALAGVFTTKGQSGPSQANAIQALTEDTGQAWLGMIRRQTDEIITHTTIMNTANGYLYAIAQNTLRTADNTELLKTIKITNSRDSG
jgi:hypothetical protein